MWRRERGIEWLAAAAGQGLDPQKGHGTAVILLGACGLRAAAKKFAGCGKFFCGPSKYAGSVLAEKLGRAHILAGIFAGRVFCGVC